MNRILYKGVIFSDDAAQANNVMRAGAKLRRTMSALSDQLEMNTLNFTVYSTDGSLSQFNRNERLTVYHDETLLGTFYLQSVTMTGPDTYEFYATSAVGLLDDSDHMGGIYTGQTLEEIVADICVGVPYSVKRNIRNTKIYGWLPIDSRRNNLSQVLFATGSSLVTDYDGVLRIEGLPSVVAHVVGLDRMYADGAGVTYDKPVTQVSVQEHNFFEVDESVELFDGTAADGDVIAFNEPVHDLTASGLEIQESGANYCVVGAGSGTITGKKYAHTVRTLTKAVSASGEINEKGVKDATLVTMVNSSFVLNRMADYYGSRNQLRAGVVFGGEAVGAVVSTVHPYTGERVSTFWETEDIVLSGTMKASVTGRIGYEPKDISQGEYYDERVLLTGSGQFVVPDGVEHVEAVLIGCGADGQPGSDGGTQTCSKSKDIKTANTPGGGSSYVTVSAFASTMAADATDGGSGGNGGAGGKVLSVSLDNVGGLTIPFTCASVIDEETVFGAFNSGDGIRIPTGYVDPVTHDIFARDGADGSNGGDGGGGGSSGQDVDGVSGGVGYDEYNSASSYTKDYTTGTYSHSIGACGGGGAGGSSGANKGQPGGDAFVPDDREVVDRSLSSNRFNVYTSSPTGGWGGNGADGGDAECYGCGGGGGGGGGGRGVSPSASASSTIKAKVSTGGTVTAYAYARTYFTTPDPDGRTGTGGRAGSGKEGCIILFYKKRVEGSSGSVMGRDGRFIRDRSGRLIIV